MAKNYSVYEAKAKFSEIIRQVREGRAVTVSYHGEPVAEIRPITKPAESVGARLSSLEERGELIRGGQRKGDLSPAGRRKGALDRFLAERGE